MLDSLVAVRELLVEGAHDGEERRDHREQAARQGQVPDAPDKMLRAAGGDTVAVLAEQGPDDGTVGLYAALGLFRDYHVRYGVRT